MSDQDIFQSNSQPSEDDQPAGGNQNPSSTNGGEGNDLLKSIVNENGEPKYKSIGDALSALKHAQEFIPQLKSENEQYRNQLTQANEELAKSAGALKALDRLAQPQAMEADRPVAQAQKEEAPNLDELVNDAISRHETRKQQQANISKVTSALSEKYGEKAGQVFYDKAKELGLDKDTMNQLAAKSPTAVLKYFQTEGTASSTASPSTSSVKSESIKQPKPVFNGSLPLPQKSMMAGASTQDLVQEIRRHRAAVYEKYGIQE